MAWMETERSALVATLRDTAPDAPTLCQGWQARHLLAHLVLREHSVLRSAVDMTTTKEPGTERFMGQLAEDARTPAGFQALVDRFAGGPPALSPLRWAGDRANLVEYVVHHEDVRRAGPQPAGPRELPVEQLQALWENATGMAKLAYRRSPVGVVLSVPGGPRSVARKGPGVVVVGHPVEQALYALGRREVADVEITGERESVEQFRAWA